MAKAKKTTGKDATGVKTKSTGSAIGRGDQDRLHIEQVRELVGLMVANDLTALEIVNGDLKVALGRGGVAVAAAPFAAGAVAPAVLAGAHARPSGSPAPNPAAEAAAKPVETLLEIKSPMVGTFYAAPSPDSEHYVVPGSRVSGDTVVCIIEAMKVMNEIKAECAGTIVDVVVANGQPVEYGQVLFRVRP
jgi:acetyl-CoA carboxylase biotin carboxyl carrier protein